MRYEPLNQQLGSAAWIPKTEEEEEEEEGEGGEEGGGWEAGFGWRIPWCVGGGRRGRCLGRSL